MITKLQHHHAEEHALSSSQIPMNTAANQRIQLLLNHLLRIFPAGKPTNVLLTPLAIFLLIIHSSKYVHAQAGGLDPSFDVDGKVSTLIGLSSSISAMALQPDGKIVVTGSCNLNGTISEIFVARYHTNGVLDSTFNNDGIAITPFSIYANLAAAITIQPDGKIIVAGSIIAQGIYDFAVIRYNPDGSLDNTFDGDGKVSTKIGTYSDEAQALALQNDGKIVVGGMSTGGTGADFALVRYNSNGSLDTSFSNDGKVTTSLSALNDAISALVIQPNGKIVVAGYSQTTTNSSDVALARYNANGSLDVSFDGDGIATTTIGSGLGFATSMVLQPDGKVIVVGQTDNGLNNDLFVFRYLSNGSLDNSFDTDGKTTLDINNKENGGGSVVLQTDGKIVIAGSCYSTKFNFCAIRYLANGSLDNTFDGDGIVETSFTAGMDGAADVVIQPDKKIVLAGSSNLNGFNSNALCRYFMDNAASLDEPNSASGIYLYPNPFSEFTTLGFNHSVHQACISLYNLCGQLIMNLKNVSGNAVTIHRNGLPAGLYLLQITEKDKVSSYHQIQIKN